MLFGLGVVRRGGQVERHAECRALADLALSPDRTVHQVDDLFHNGKAEAAAAHLVDARVDRAGKGRIHLLHELRRHADARDGLAVVVKQLRQLHRLRDDFELPALDARDVRHIVDELLQVAAADTDLFQALFHLIRIVRVL